MKREILILVLILTLIQVFSQTKNNENIYFIKFKIYQKDFSTGVPFVEICLSDKNYDFIANCVNTDYEGYAIFLIDPNKYNIDSTYLIINILKGNSDNGNPYIIQLDQIKLLKDVNIENELNISMTDYKILSEKEYNKYSKKNVLMPARQATQAVDVR